MAEEKIIQTKLIGKLDITGTLTVLTGMHIGGGSDFAPIGAVDSPFVRDLLTHDPIIPGSSLKGKLRTLLARNGHNTELTNNINTDDGIVKRLFGSTADSQKPMATRLQFFDLFVTDLAKEKFQNIETDTYMGEVKSENTINRLTGVANPRQIERVPRGMEFSFRLVYNIENENDVITDMEVLKQGFDLLKYDYIGGHGSRGYGRVEIKVKDVKVRAQVQGQTLDVNSYLNVLKEN